MKAFYLKSHELAFTKDFHGQYLKMNLIDQNDKGNVFGVGYQNNGHFYMSVFDNAGNDIASVDVNEALSIDDNSKPISGFYEPLITLAF